MSSQTSAITAAVLGLVGLAILRPGYRRLQGLTLMAPWAWTVVSLAAVTLVEILIGAAGDDREAWIGPLRMAAAMTTFCPLMAVLGAKRPQDRAWQFIVFSLWVILSLPSAESWLFSGGAAEMHPARSWFLLILVTVGVLNYLPTRFWLASLLFGAAEVVLLDGFLPWSAQFPTDRIAPSLWALALFLVALGVVAILARQGRRDRAPLDQVWLEFRDCYGAVWGLRIAERVNASAKMYGWPTSLTWQGLANEDAAQPTPEIQQALDETFKTLLRRFVSPEWFARLGATKLADPPTELPLSAGATPEGQQAERA